MALYDTSLPDELMTGMRLARGAIGRGELVVIPTDTVYGIAADAFAPAAVARLLAAKGRDRSSPPPVLVPGIPTLDALAESVPDVVRALVAEFWPGGLTIVLRARPTLDWDLGDTHGTVALRMPSDRIALELLSETGPLAVSSANRTGEPPAATAAAAQDSLGDAISVYLESGPVGTGYGAGQGVGSTIVDASDLGTPNGRLRILRRGVVTEDAILRISGSDG